VVKHQKRREKKGWGGANDSTGLVRTLNIKNLPLWAGPHSKGGKTTERAKIGRGGERKLTVNCSGKRFG